jgi:hypothetical protein
MNPHQRQHLKSCTKKYKEQVKHGWKCHVGKTELQEVQYVCKDTVFNITFFSGNCIHFSHILPLEQTEGTRSGTHSGYKYQYKYTF